MFYQIDMFFVVVVSSEMLTVIIVETKNSKKTVIEYVIHLKKMMIFMHW